MIGRAVTAFNRQKAGSVRATPEKAPGALKERLIAIVVVVALPAVFIVWTLSGGDPRGPWVLVTQVTDGDTIGVGRGWRYEKVRFIGVDTPETVHPDKPVEPFGPEASAFTARRLKGRQVRLAFEPANHYDRYDRLLAYVFLMDGSLFNAELVKQGYARVIAPTPFRYYEAFKRYERQARRARLGLWSAE